MGDNLLRNRPRDLNVFIVVSGAQFVCNLLIRRFLWNWFLLVRIWRGLGRWVGGRFCQSWRWMLKFIFRLFFLDLVLVNFTGLEVLTKGLLQLHLRVIVQVWLKLLLDMLDRTSVVGWKILWGLARGDIQVVSTELFAAYLIVRGIAAAMGRPTNRWNTDCLNTCASSVNLCSDESISSQRWGAPTFSSAMTAMNVPTDTSGNDRAKRCWMGISRGYRSPAGKLIDIGLSVSYFSLLFKQVLLEFLLRKLLKRTFIFDKVCSHLPFEHFYSLLIINHKLGFLIQKLEEHLSSILVLKNLQEDFDLILIRELFDLDGDIIRIPETKLGPLNVVQNTPMDILVCQLVWIQSIYMQLYTYRRVHMVNNVQEKGKVPAKNLSVQRVRVSHRHYLLLRTHLVNLWLFLEMLLPHRIILVAHVTVLSVQRRVLLDLHWAVWHRQNVLIRQILVP